jgi:thymidylate kinase
VIEPALAAGRWIVCDRFSDSTYAYQCGGRGLDATLVERLEAIVHPGLQPDATFLFDIDPATAADRQAARSRKAAAPTFSAAGLYFMGPLYDAQWGLPDEATLGRASASYDGPP